MSSIKYYCALKQISLDSSETNSSKKTTNQQQKKNNKQNNKQNNNNQNNKRNNKRNNKKGSSSKASSSNQDDGKVTFSASKADFAKWYEQIIPFAEIMDKRFPVKGMPVFRPYGFYIHNKIMQIIGDEWEKQGIERALFPLLVPQNFLELEGDHVAGFQKEVYWVTHGGETKLEPPKALRPTSETIMYYMFAIWIRSFRDLPLKVHQTCNVFRYETKQTRPLIRAREIHWNEAHTAHATAEQAMENLENAWKSYLYLINDCCAFYGLRLRRPEWDKFPGSVYTDVLDTVMPCGRVLQTVGAHFLGTKFSSAFDIKFLDEKNKYQLAHLTCYGISTRLLAALLSLHGDDKGLVLPPILARYQVVIVPISMRKKDRESVNAKAKQVQRILEASNVRTYLDDSNQKPGAKYYYWEMKGVPIRVEIGPRDVQNNCVMVATRDNGKKQKLDFANLVVGIHQTMEELTERLKQNALKHHQDTITTCLSQQEMVDTVKKGGFARIPFYSVAKDGNEGDEKVHELCGGEVRGHLPDEQSPAADQLCIITGKPAKYW
eukprot:CAMPEP_0201552120 /NCGR_PEP_ID=MMETSP0173_2-20130828/14328_1 /ASSEMBLY_ACC=CAM_ASM_000268 /TAXON_ID=218659 /ORGANISM="Vexillifera sp., Strain DIVA3 564/2" /LENGTH=547 /DNA_ID=CAMNT_0047962547 /DNA_START=28 /DNA_END=1668 /DNA_ORIENTATION=+